MPQMLRKQHWMKNLLQKEGVSETRSHWKTVKRRTSYSQLASLKRHWRKRTGQSPDEGHEQGMFCIFWRSQDPSCCDWVWLCGTQNSLRSQSRWRLGPVARAMRDEVKAHQDNENWNLVRPPRDRDVIPGKWVYKVKLGPSGQVDKYKVRYVEGRDYFETFGPICKPETFRILLQLSAKQGHVMHQFDVKTAFLHSPIEEEVYLEQPQEFAKRRSYREKLVCRLN